MSKLRNFKLNCKNTTSNCDMSNCSLANITAKGILLETAAFYKIYCRLEKENYIPFEDEKAMDEYYEKRMQDDYVDLKVVEIVNGALAVELALKYLTFKENKTFKQIHNLDTLYNGLPEPHKSVLKSKIFTQAHQDENALNKNLKVIANSFENWRYFFEKDGVGTSNFFNDFVHIICEYALSFKEE
ncbi:MAG: hypothetical protein E7346_04360 [Clostridiales bacterium]|nr:hypothetical protein [Clostridiales bacterium]